MFDKLINSWASVAAPIDEEMALALQAPNIEGTVNDHRPLSRTIPGGYNSSLQFNHTLPTVHTRTHNDPAHQQSTQNMANSSRVKPLVRTTKTISRMFPSLGQHTPARKTINLPSNFTGSMSNLANHGRPSERESGQPSVASTSVRKRDHGSDSDDDLQELEEVSDGLRTYTTKTKVRILRRGDAEGIGSNHTVDSSPGKDQAENYGLLSRDYTSKKQEADHLREQLGVVTGCLEGWKSECERLKLERKTATQALEEALGAGKEAGRVSQEQYQKEIDESARRFAAMAGERDNAIRLAEDWKQKLESAHHQTARTEKAMAEDALKAEHSAKAYQEKIAQLTKDLSKASGERDSAACAAAEWQQKLESSCEATKSEIENAKEALKGEHTTDMRTHQAEITRLTQALAEAGNERDTAARIAEDWQQKLKAMPTEGEYTTQVNTYQERIAQLTQDLSKASSERDEAVRTASDWKQQLESSCDAAKVEIANAKEALKGERATYMDTYQAELARLTQALTGAENERDIAARAAEDWQKKLEAMSAEETEYTTKINAYQKKISQLTGDLSKASSERDAAARAASNWQQQLESSLETTKVEIANAEALKGEHASSMSTHQAEIARLTQALTQAANERDNANRSVGNWRQKVEFIHQDAGTPHIPDSVRSAGCSMAFSDCLRPASSTNPPSHEAPPNPDPAPTDRVPAPETPLNSSERPPPGGTFDQNPGPNFNAKASGSGLSDTSSTQQTPVDRPNVPPSSFPPNYSFPLHEDITGFGSAMKEMTREIKCLLGDVAETRKLFTPQSPAQKPTTKTNGNFRQKRPSKPRTTSRNEMLASVRGELNTLLNINHDAEIVHIIGDASLIASATDVEDFLSGLADPPSVSPLRPFWEHIQSPWNAHLADRFAVEFKQDFPDISVEQEEIVAYFLQRLQTLKKILDRAVPRDGETPEEHQSRVENREQQTLADARRRSRRDRRYRTRMQICTTGQEADNNNAWALLFAMSEALGHDGHSSDESDDGDKKVVLCKEWRSAEVNELLRFIDDNRTTKNAYGTPLPGSTPSVRVWGRHGPFSQKSAVAGLPRNFYDNVWFDALTEIEKAHLDALGPIELPVIH